MATPFITKCREQNSAGINFHKKLRVKLHEMQDIRFILAKIRVHEILERTGSEERQTPPNRSPNISYTS